MQAKETVVALLDRLSDDCTLRDVLSWAPRAQAAPSVLRVRDGLVYLCKGGGEAVFGGRVAGDVAEAHDHEIQARDDEDALHAVAGHQEGIGGQGIAAGAIQPELSAVHGLVPGRCGRRDEVDKAFGQQAFAEPDAVPEVQQAETRPVAGRSEVVAGQQEVAAPVGLEHLTADADAVEEGALWEAPVVLAAPLDDAANDGAEHQRVAVAVAADADRRVLERAVDGEAEDVAHAGVDLQVIGYTAKQ